MKILAVDDEKLQLNKLTNAIKEANQDYEVYSFSNPLLALEAEQSNDIDIAFLDIEMPGMSGIELAKKLKGINPKINIIFVTGYSQYAIDAFEIHASGYITKPVSEEKIIKEINSLRFPVEDKQKSKNIINVKCFGNFEVFANGRPLNFDRSKTKELFAYLIDRKGASCTMKELCAVLWEDGVKLSYLRNLISDLVKTLKSVGAENVFVKSFNACYINTDNVNCDLYDYEKGLPSAVNAYLGEYMAQYSWAESTNAMLQLGKV